MYLFGTLEALYMSLGTAIGYSFCWTKTGLSIGFLAGLSVFFAIIVLDSNRVLERRENESSRKRRQDDETPTIL